MNGKDNYETLALYIRKGAVRFDNCCLRQTVRNFHYAFNTIARVAQWTRRDPPKVEIAGSSPAVSSFFYWSHLLWLFFLYIAISNQWHVKLEPCERAMCRAEGDDEHDES